MDSSSDSEAPMLAEGGSSPPQSAPPKPYPPSPLLKDRLAQLRQSATCDDALMSLKQIVREMQPSAVPRFLTHLQSDTAGSPRKPAYSHHAISLYVSLAREHKDKLVPQIPRVMRNLMLHLKSPGVGGSIVGSPGGGCLESSVHGACEQVVLELARIPIKEEQAKAQLLQDICSPLIGALSKTENGPLYGVPSESFGAAHCLKALVDASDIWQHASDGLVDDICSETAEALQVEGAAVFLQLACSLARCNISICQHYASDLLRAAGHALQWQSASWQQRFAAAKLYTEVLSKVDQDVALSLEKSALNVLESCQTSDPSPYVCAQVVDAIRALVARTNRPLLRGPRTPDASPPRRTPHASPPSKSPPDSPPQSGLKPTASAESPKMAPKRSKPNVEKRTAVLESADWPSEDPNSIFGGSPIYDVLNESEESPLLLLKARGVTSQGSGKMSLWSEERTSGEQGLGVLAKSNDCPAETNDWRKSVKLMQSAEWPTLASGSPVYDPDDLDLTLGGLDECPVESTEAFFPVTQLNRTPQKTPPVLEQPASPEATPVVALARTPVIAHEGDVKTERFPEEGQAFDEEKEPLDEDQTPPSFSKQSELSLKTSAPEAAVKSTSLSELGEMCDEDQTSPNSPKPSDFPTNQFPEKAQPEPVFVSKIPRPPSTRTNDQTTVEQSVPNGQEPTKEPLTVDTAGVPASPSSQGSPPQKSPSRIPTPTSIPRPKATVVGGSNIPPPPSLTRFQSPQPERHQKVSLQQQEEEQQKTKVVKKGSFEERLCKVAGDKAVVKELGKQAEQMLKEAKPSRRKSSLGPSDFLSTSPRQMLRRLAAESPVKESPTTTPRSVLALRGPRGNVPSTSFAQDTADFTPPDTPVGESALNGVDEAPRDNVPRTSSADFTPPDTPVGEGGVNGVREAPRDNVPSTAFADFTPPDTPVVESGVNGVSENGFVIDMDVEEQSTPTGKEERSEKNDNQSKKNDKESEKNAEQSRQNRRRKWSVNGVKAAGRYSLDADSGSESEKEESGEKEPGQREEQDEQSGETTGGTSSTKATADDSPVQEMQSAEKRETSEKDGINVETNGVLQFKLGVSEKDEANRKVDRVSETKSGHSQSLDTSSKTSAEGLSNEWCVHENPIAGRPSTSSAWEASESTFDEDTLRRMSEGEEVSSPEGWEERHVAESDSMNEQDLERMDMHYERHLDTNDRTEKTDQRMSEGEEVSSPEGFGVWEESHVPEGDPIIGKVSDIIEAPSEGDMDKDERTERTDASKEARAAEANDKEGKEVFTFESVLASKVDVESTQERDSASESERTLSDDKETGAEGTRKEESHKQSESEASKTKGEVLQEEASNGTKSAVVEGTQARHKKANEETPRGTSEGSASEIKSPDVAPTSQRKLKKRVSFSEHNEIQLIDPNPPPETIFDERRLSQTGLSIRKWYKLAEKGVKRTVITIATLELGVLFYVVSRGVWQAFCAPTFNVPLPS